MKNVLFFLLYLQSVLCQVTQTDITNILSIHNSIRANVGSAALTWDPIAATVAQNYANGCVYAHNANRDTQYAGAGGNDAQGVGENIAAGAPTLTIPAAIYLWYNETVFFNCPANTCATDQVCGHYTQIIWDTTTQVGCGYTHCTINTPFGSNFPDWDFLVCDYNPAGNVVGEAPVPAADCNLSPPATTAKPTTQGGVTTAKPTQGGATTAKSTTQVIQTSLITTPIQPTGSNTPTGSNAPITQSFAIRMMSSLSLLLIAAYLVLCV